ncbi:TonB-dependent receptor [Flavobacterium arcticum]|uniref:TonB-dependent receptor n=1 Tax=Flavobacterium arcticum TaxID=1784713 RepID=A0A345HBC7_9FLAO|nr:carboxypeptidase regulatory-like domain-containing protein [Flavobacterium arcticum]AXG73887.1 TonB-dependent receptor [Flavobacterium arcticum]KAF2508863.1 TonB-dependent receptor [Flavobacterium arcticum]
MKKLVFSLLVVMQVMVAWSQQVASVKGTVVDSKSQDPMQNVTATLQGINQTVLTNAEGVFVFESVIEGNLTVTIATTGFSSKTLNIQVKQGETLDLGVIMLEDDITTEQQLSLITLTENDLGDDNGGSESTAGLLQASRDAFMQAAAYNFGQARFRVRGLDNEYGKTMINGVPMDKMYDGRPQWSNWGGLNDATRNQEFTIGSDASDYTFGSILGTQEINTRASNYRPGTRISLSGTNTNYSWRTMATHASGMSSEGWAYVISGSRRWATEGYFEGTDYDANSLFVSLEKKINDKHSLNFTSIYAQNKRGKSAPNTQEVVDLAGEKYNSYWGWQDGKKRNSRDKDVEEPIFMLSHYWQITDATSLNTNIAYQFGKIGNSRLDFNYTRNPDPTYYRNLPSYYTTQHDFDTGEYLGDSPDNIRDAGLAKTSFLANRQIDWDKLYENNLENGESLAVLYEDRRDDNMFTANSILNSRLTDNIILNAGVTYRKLESHNFQNLLDLLGGTGYLDIDPFLFGDARQTDLNNPNRVVGVNDKFGYNYKLHADVIDAFTQFKFTYGKADFYLSQNFSRSQYQREGLYKNGNYADNSFGKSDKKEFNNFGFKGGFTYKITGRHILDFNGLYMTKAPTLRNSFPNARLNNNFVDGLENEKIMGGDLSYIIRAPNLKARFTAYYSKITDATDIGFYFTEGLGVLTSDGTQISENGNAFVSETVTGLDRVNMGTELSLEYKVTATITATAVAAYGQYTYDSNPNVKLNVDNIRSTVDFGRATLKDYKQPGMPQQAYSFQLEYRDPHYWWVGASVNYLADSYVDISPLLRTDNFFINNEDANGFPFPEATEEGARELLKQEKLDPATLINLKGGKSWRISYGKTIGVFVSVNNVFDFSYKTGGFEQARNANYRQLSQDLAGPTRSFGTKYFYGYGRNYFVNLYLNF